MSLKNKGEIRAVEENDWPQIYTLIERVFLRQDEAQFLRELQEKQDLVYIRVIDRNSELIGLIAYPRLKLITDAGFHNALVLAPFVIDPLWQGHGLGTELIKQSHSDLMAENEKLIFVLGEEDYYRFGYSREAASAYSGPYNSQFLLANKWSKDIPETGELVYPMAFANVIG